MSFRKYGGIQFNAHNNYVRSKVSDAGSLNITDKIGEFNTKVICESHLDLAGSSIINVGNIYYADGSGAGTTGEPRITKATYLANDKIFYDTNTFNTATNFNNNIVMTLGSGGFIQFPDGTTQATAAVETTGHAYLTNNQSFTGINTFNNSGFGVITNNLSCKNIYLGQTANLQFELSNNILNEATIHSRGMTIAWNLSGDTGETDFINFSEYSTAGGFFFYSASDVDSSSNPLTAPVYIAKLAINDINFNYNPTITTTPSYPQVTITNRLAPISYVNSAIGSISNNIQSKTTSIYSLFQAIPPGQIGAIPYTYTITFNNAFTTAPNVSATICLITGSESSTNSFITIQKIDPAYFSFFLIVNNSISTSAQTFKLSWIATTL